MARISPFKCIVSSKNITHYVAYIPVHLRPNANIEQSVHHF